MKPIAFTDDLSFGEILRRLPAELEGAGPSQPALPRQDRPRRRDGRAEPGARLPPAVGAAGGDAPPRRPSSASATSASPSRWCSPRRASASPASTTDRRKVDGLLAGQPHVHEVGLPELLREQLDGNFAVASELPEGGDVFVVAVGTPVVDGPEGPEPTLDDPRGGRDSSRAGVAAGRPGRPAVHRARGHDARGRAADPRAGEPGLRCGIDFHLAFAPERTVEGLRSAELRELPQIIGGINDDSVEATAALFRELTPTIVRMESLEAAELAKLVNNAFRDLIFAFANEVAQVAAAYDFDVVERHRGGEPRLSARPGAAAEPRRRRSVPHEGSVHPGLVGARARPPYDAVPPRPRGQRVDARVRRRARRQAARGARQGSAQLHRAAVRPGVQGRAGDRRRPPLDRRSTSPSGCAAASGRCSATTRWSPIDEIASLGLEPVALAAGLPRADAVLFLNNHRSYRTLDIFDVVRALRPPPVVFDGWHLFRSDDVIQACPTVYLGLGFTRSSVR